MSNYASRIVTLESDSLFGKISFKKLINISGKQRMLSQEIPKIYIFLFNNPTDLETKKKLETSKKIFEAYHQFLIENTSSNTIKDLEEVLDIWKRFKIVLESETTISSVKKIINSNTALLNATNKVVKSIILDAKANNNKLEKEEFKKINNLYVKIDICGQQTAFFQRLALYYFATSKEFTTDKRKNILKSTFDNIDYTISDLSKSPVNDDNINISLNDSLFLWEEIKEKKEKILSQEIENQEVFNYSNILTTIFNKLSALYESVPV